MTITALTKTAPQPRPPRATPRPTSAVRHGITLTDEFAWLRDRRWQAVMRDPSLLDPDIRAYLEAENAYAEATLAPNRAAAGCAVCGDAGPDQGGRRGRSRPRRAVCLFQPAIAKAASIR